MALDHARIGRAIAEGTHEYTTDEMLTLLVAASATPPNEASADLLETCWREIHAASPDRLDQIDRDLLDARWLVAIARIQTNAQPSKETI